MITYNKSKHETIKETNIPDHPYHVLIPHIKDFIKFVTAKLLIIKLLQ